MLQRNAQENEEHDAKLISYNEIQQNHNGTHAKTFKVKQKIRILLHDLSSRESSQQLVV